MTTTIQYAVYLPADYPPENIDAFGYARLRDQARNQRLQLVGDATRVYDVPAVGVLKDQGDGTMAITYVEATAPEAAGRTPDARLIRWEIQAGPMETTESVKVAAVVLADGMLARAEMPPAVTEQGALVELAHGLGGEVTVKAFGVNGDPIGYTFGVPIDDNTHELTLPPGVQRLEATRDPDEDEDGPQ